MAIVYLDIDDEITSAAARIRWTEDLELAIVLPAGSRIATSRINFRLLAREAADRSRRLAIVAPEASTRALAASAGLPVFATVMEYEESRREAVDEESAGEGPTEPERPARAGPAPAGQQASPVGARPAGKGASRGSGRGASAPGVAGRAGAAPSTAPLWPDQPAPGTTAAPAGRAARRTATAGGHLPRAGHAGRRRATKAGPGRGRPVNRPGHGGPRPGSRPRRWPLVVAALLVVAILGGAGPPSATSCCRRPR